MTLIWKVTMKNKSPSKDFKSNLDIDSCAHLSPAERNQVAVRITHLKIKKVRKFFGDILRAVM